MDDQQPDNWACCSIRNKDEVKYFTQVIFGLIIIAFSMFQIIQNTDDKHLFINILSTTFGLFLPAPSIRQQ